MAASSDGQRPRARRELHPGPLRRAPRADTLDLDVVQALFDPKRTWAGEVYGWGTPGADIASLLHNLGDLLASLGATPVTAQLSRRLEEAIAGHAVPEAGTAPMPALFLTL